MTHSNLLEVPSFLKKLAQENNTISKTLETQKGEEKVTKDNWLMRYDGNYWLPVKDLDAVEKLDSPKAIQQFILERLNFNTVSTPNVNYKKKPFLKWLREQNVVKGHNFNPSSINRQLNNLIKLRAIDIDTTYKTKKFVITGKHFNLYFRKAN